MKKYVLAVVTAAAVIAAALIPSGPPVEAATPGFGSAVSAIKQTSWQTNNSVNALAISGNTVFAGGLFTKIRQPGKPAGQGEAVRTYIAAFNRTTGAPTAFAPKLNGPVYSIATSPDGNWVVIGGDFTTVNGIKRSKIAMFSVVTGKMVSAWDPVVSARVKALAIFGNSVFIGGAFGKIDNVVRSHLGAVRLIQGDLLPWNPVANGDVYAIDLSDNGTRVFVGGPFSRINGKDHYSLAMTNNTTGAAFSFPAAAAIPKPTATCTTRVKDIDTLGDNVYVSNGGDGGGCYDGVLAAKVSTGGTLLWKNNCLGATEAIKAIGNWVYKGSHAHNCSDSGAFPDGTGTHYLLVESAINGKIGPWFPNTDADQASTTQVGPLAMAGTSTDLWVGGDFLNVNGKPQRGLTRFTNVPGGAAPAVPKAPILVPSSDKVQVKFSDVYDLDNISLTYNVFRGSTNVGSFKYMSYYWEPRKLYTVADTGVKSGQTYSYHIEVHDGRNIMKGPSVSVKVP